MDGEIPSTRRWEFSLQGVFSPVPSGEGGAGAGILPGEWALNRISSFI